MGYGDKVRVGVIGAGILGTTHVKFCMKHPDVEVAAVADIVKEKAKKLAGEAGARADLTVFKLEEGRFQYTDCMGESRIGKQKLTPVKIIKDGQVIV